MLAVLKENPAPGVALRDVPIPTPAVGEILIKVVNASICGTDVGIYDWIPWAASQIAPPRIIGHEVVGEVVQIPDGTDTTLRVGDLVSSETHIFCGNCALCRSDQRHICENMELFGIGRNGSFAEYATLPARTAWKNDPSIPLDHMSVQEPLGNAVYVAEKAEVRGKRILVLGLGPTGLCAGAVSKAYGASEVVGLDPHPYRRALAERMGFDRTAATVERDSFNSFDAILEMSGNAAALQTGLDAVKIGGTLIAFGISKVPVTIDWGKYFINKELTVRSVFGRRIWQTWEQMTELLKSGRVTLEPLITHRFALSEFEEAMRVMKSGECGKILLHP